MTIAHVAGQTYLLAFTTSGTSIGVSPAQALGTGSGNTMVIGTRGDSNGGALPDDHGVTDTLSNTYTKRRTHVFVTEHRASVFSAPITTGGSTTITFSSAGDGASRRVIVGSEYTGAGGLNYDVGNSTTGTSNSPDSGNATPSSADSLLFGWINDSNNGSPYSSGGSFTERGDSGAAAARCTWMDQIVSASAAYSASATATNIVSWTAMIGVFIEAGGGAANNQIAWIKA